MEFKMERNGNVRIEWSGWINNEWKRREEDVINWEINGKKNVICDDGRMERVKKKGFGNVKNW